MDWKLVLQELLGEDEAQKFETLRAKFAHEAQILGEAPYAYIGDVEDLPDFYLDAIEQADQIFEQFATLQIRAGAELFLRALAGQAGQTLRLHPQLQRFVTEKARNEATIETAQQLAMPSCCKGSPVDQRLTLKPSGSHFSLRLPSSDVVHIAGSTTTTNNHPHAAPRAFCSRAAFSLSCSTIQYRFTMNDKAAAVSQHSI